MNINNIDEKLTFISNEPLSNPKFLKISKVAFKASNKTIYREIILKQNAVIIFALDKDNNVYLTSQPRAGVNKAHSIELPAGLIDEGESPIEAAKRELKEETGCTLQKGTSLIPLGSFIPDPACCTNRTYLFFARVEKTTELNLDEDEILESFKIPLFEFDKMIEENILEDASSIIARIKVSKYLNKKEDN